MNLKLEDLSQYIVVIIFILIIIKVLGDGLIRTIYELFTGKKNEEEFDIDSMISRKKSQLSISPKLNSESREELKLRDRVLSLESQDKEKLLDILKSIEWGDINTEYARDSLLILEDITQVRGLAKVAKFFFLEQLDIENKDLLSSWKKIYDNSILWTNLINTSQTLADKRALVSFKNSNISQVISLNDQSLNKGIEDLLNPDVLSSINFMGKLFSKVDPGEIFEQYTEKLNLFKSLEPILPINKETSNEWAHEILGLEYGEYSDEVIKKQYKSITSRIHPDKYSSLDLSDDQVSILNSNLALVNKAYTFLKK